MNNLEKNIEPLNEMILKIPTGFPNAPYIPIEILLKLNKIFKLTDNWKEFGFDKDMLKTVLDDNELEQYENGKITTSTVLEKLACHELSIDRDELANEIRIFIDEEKNINN